eukprot:1510289-Prymnesium_polylepis.1
MSRSTERRRRTHRHWTRSRRSPLSAAPEAARPRECGSRHVTAMLEGKSVSERRSCGMHANDQRQ